MKQITIDPELQNLIPPLSPEEYSQLEENILQAGCRDPLVLWGDILIDGHNRYEICRKHNIEFKTVKEKLDSKGAVKVWMIKNQFGTRVWHGK